MRTLPSLVLGLALLLAACGGGTPPAPVGREITTATAIAQKAATVPVASKEGVAVVAATTPMPSSNLTVATITATATTRGPASTPVSQEKMLPFVDLNSFPECAEYVDDVDFLDDNPAKGTLREEVEADTEFTVTRLYRNCGKTHWPEGTYRVAPIKYSGEPARLVKSFVSATPPGGIATVAYTLRAPKGVGNHQRDVVLQGPDGKYIPGDKAISWVQYRVIPKKNP
jgi:hypothetical protein